MIFQEGATKMVGLTKILQLRDLINYLGDDRKGIGHRAPLAAMKEVGDFGVLV